RCSRRPHREAARFPSLQQRLRGGRPGRVSIHPLNFSRQTSLMNHRERLRRASSGVKTAVVWLIGHGASFLPALVIAVVVALTWQTLKQVHPRDILSALRMMNGAWLLIAAAVTALNIAVMGLYDVVAFPHTNTDPIERWRYGAVAFAWSNFLTLGPFAG